MFATGGKLNFPLFLFLEVFMISLRKYVLSYIYKIKHRPKIDIDFWNDIFLIDLEEDLHV